jgi:hypothetical protein
MDADEWRGDGETTMRRWFAATAAVVTVLAVSGCGVDLPKGTDGDITDEWRPITAPVMFAPEAGTCHEKLEAEVSMDTDRPVPCTALHVTETVAIGTLGEAGQSVPTAVPEHGDQYELDAYQDCAERVSTFLGGPWRSGRIEVNVVLPTQAGWSGGARWYRCDVTEINIDNGRPVARTGSMARGLAGSQPLLLRCFNPKVSGDFVDTMTAVACTKPHRAEFAGLWTAPASWSYSKLRKDQKNTEKGCLGVIARFAKIPDNADTRYRVGWISYHPTADEWDRDVRGVQCFLWKSGTAMTRSMKGAGTKGLPINYG